MDLVRIAESYFLEMLFNTPAERAVADLQSAWHRRATLGGWANLAEPEKVVDRASSYAFLVRTGGHGLYFSSSPRQDVDSTVEALEAVALGDVAEIVRSALAICMPYPETRPPEHALRRVRFVSDDPRLAKFDRAVWDKPMYEAILEYVRQNKAAVLLPERGAP